MRRLSLITLLLAVFAVAPPVRFLFFAILFVTSFRSSLRQSVLLFYQEEHSVKPMKVFPRVDVRLLHGDGRQGSWQLLVQLDSVHLSL